MENGGTSGAENEHRKLKALSKVRNMESGKSLNIKIIISCLLLMTSCQSDKRYNLDLNSNSMVFPFILENQDQNIYRNELFSVRIKKITTDNKQINPKQVEIFFDDFDLSNKVQGNYIFQQRANNYFESKDYWTLLTIDNYREDDWEYYCYYIPKNNRSILIDYEIYNIENVKVFSSQLKVNLNF